MALQIDGALDGVVTFADRVAVTVGLVVLLFAVGWLSNWVRGRVDLESENVERVINAGIALGLFVVALVIGFVLLSLWGVSLYAMLGVTTPVTLLTRAVITVVLLLGAYVITGVIKRVVYDVTEDQTAITRHQTELVFRSTQVVLYAVAGVIVFGVWEINLGGLLVGAGFLGIVVGLAARQTLGSLVAGFVLMFSRPFEIGDWVAIDDREGIVTEISIVNTRVQTFDGEYAMIPNDMVASSEIINRTRKGRLRLHVEVGVDYDTDIEHAISVTRDAARDVDEVLSVPQPDVVATEFGASSIVLDVRFWIDKPSARRRWRAQTAVVRAVKAAFDREGIKIPFPQRELSGRAETGGFRIADPGAPAVESPPDATPDGGDG